MSRASEGVLRRELASGYRQVCSLGLNSLASGNLSCRCGEGMLISASGATEGSVSEENLVYVAANGDWSGPYKPSSEWLMHSAIYRDNPATEAVVHTHSDYCVAVACQNKPLPGFHYLVGLFGGKDVPCVPYATFGSVELAENAAAALQDRNACYLANHGMISRASGLAEAITLAHRLEIMSRQYILSSQLGEPKVLTDEDWGRFFTKVQAVSYGRSQ